MPAYAYFFLHLGCYLLGLSSRSRHAGSKRKHILYFDIWSQAALWKDCASLHQFTQWSLFLLNLFHFDFGSPIRFTLWPGWGHLSAEELCVNSCFPLVHEIISCWGSAVTEGTSEGGRGGVWCSCCGPSWSRKDGPWSMRKPAERTTLMNVKHCCLQPACWSRLVDLIRFCKGAEASGGRLPFSKMATAPAPTAYAVYSGPSSPPSRGRAWFLSSSIWAGQGLLWPIESGGNDALPEFLNHKFGSKIKWWLLYVTNFWVICYTTVITGIVSCHLLGKIVQWRAAIFNHRVSVNQLALSNNGDSWATSPEVLIY